MKIYPTQKTYKKVSINSFTLFQKYFLKTLKLLSISYPASERLIFHDKRIKLNIWLSNLFSHRIKNRLLRSECLHILELLKMVNQEDNQYNKDKSIYAKRMIQIIQTNDFFSD